MEQSGADEPTPAPTAAEQRRAVVAQATGVLMARFRIDSTAAIVKLATIAAEDTRPVVDVAREIVEKVNRSASDATTHTDAHPHD